ncbi:MAG TPA: 50S ribosomal protein L18e [Candidatus Bathyarchaeota archaeon]|nr:MAG: 50S ribosomal protein L18e [Candidatus Bathyarchaeota archaeon ex4484_231]RLG93121.1 MAG: 50S ribosomal protein L18e [Candidatus Bathyarchaeota archaeon]HDI06778.1 50S ribosomal protein L18e [Candidatus Bathyarchaeota archaeon]
MKKLKTTNPELVSLIRFLKKASRENNAEIWRDIAEKLYASKRRRVAVNLSRINRYTKKGDYVAVPGKVLGTGTLEHAVKVAAFSFSEKAKEKIRKVRGSCLTFQQLVKKNPKGSNVKVIG